MQAKHIMFLEERIYMLKESCSHLKNIEVDFFDGLLVEYARKRNARVVVRGLRAVSDFEYEFTMAMMNKKLADDVETLYMMAANEYRVRQLKHNQGSRRSGRKHRDHGSSNSSQDDAR